MVSKRKMSDTTAERTSSLYSVRCRVSREAPIWLGFTTMGLPASSSTISASGVPGRNAQVGGTATSGISCLTTSDCMRLFIDKAEARTDPKLPCRPKISARPCHAPSSPSFP